MATKKKLTVQQLLDRRFKDVTELQRRERKERARKKATSGVDAVTGAKESPPLKKHGVTVFTTDDELVRERVKRSIAKQSKSVAKAAQKSAQRKQKNKRK